jgi:hypothetical protein
MAIFEGPDRNRNIMVAVAVAVVILVIIYLYNDPSLVLRNVDPWDVIAQRVEHGNS